MAHDGTTDVPGLETPPSSLCSDTNPASRSEPNETDISKVETLGGRDETSRVCRTYPGTNGLEADGGPIVVEQPNLYDSESGPALVIKVGHANNCTVQCHRDGVNHSPDS